MIPSLSVFRWASNQVINEMVLDGGGYLSPAGIVGSHTIYLLLSSQTAHDRAVGKAQETQYRELTRGYSTSLDREVLTPSSCE